MALAALFQADPRVSKIAAQIRAQQKVVAPKGIVIPDENIDDMAAQFVARFGIGDARNIDSTYIGIEQGGDSPQTVYYYAFTRKGEALQDDHSNAIGYGQVEGPEGTSTRVYFGTSADGKLDYLFFWSPAIGAPIFESPPHVDISFWKSFAPFALIMASFVGLPAIIGDAVLGADFAAANPLISEAVGKASLQLTLTGGDPKSLTGLVATATGVQVGDFVGSAVDSAAVGTIAQAATGAAIQGKNAGTAAAKAAFFTLGGSMGDFTEVDTTLEDLGLDPGTLTTLDIQAQNELAAYGFTGNELFADNTGSLLTVSGQVAQASVTEWADGYYTDSSGNVRDITNRVVIPADQAANMTDGQIADALFNDWMAQQAQTVTTQPGDTARPDRIAQPTAQTKVPSITDQAKTVDALLKTATSIANSIHILSTGRPLPYQTNPYGMNRTTLPGVTITRPDGSTVTNNGNGTQTIRYPDGRVTTTSTSYTGAGSLIPGVTNQALLIGGAILVGAVLLARRK